MSAAFWKVFELAISVWENILLLEFCMDFMQQKPRGKKGKVLWGIAVLFGLIFPALEKYPALYDRWEMWITLIWLFVYLMVGGKEEFYVEEQTRINGVNYILVSDSKDDEANAYILKDISTDTDAEAEYVMVEDDTEFDAVSGVFASMLDDEADITY